MTVCTVAPFGRRIKGKKFNQVRQVNCGSNYDLLNTDKVSGQRQVESYGKVPRSDRT